MGKTITLSRRSGQDDGYRDDLPLSQDLDGPLVVDARGLVGALHPMFLVRLRIFVDWHREFGREVKVLGPVDQRCAQQLADMRVFAGLPEGVFAPSSSVDATSHRAVVPVRRLESHHDVEDAAQHATDVLEQQVPALAAWGDPVHMAVSELCGNAIQHGSNDALPAYVAADRVDGDHRVFRLAVADLGIGIPEHIRGQHPEWHDDTGAISRALVRGVTGTRDHHLALGRIRGGRYGSRGWQVTSPRRRAAWPCASA